MKKSILILTVSAFLIAGCGNQKTSEATENFRRNIANYHPDIVAKMVDIALSQHIPNEHFNVTLPKR